MNNNIENLKALRAQVDSAISYFESGMPMKDMTPLERDRRLLNPTRFFDLIIGDFGITRINGCKTCRPRYEKTNQEEA